MKMMSTLRTGAVVAATLAWSGAAVADGYSSPARYYAPGYNWSGVYAGGGVGWTQTDASWAFDPPAVGGIQAFTSSTNTLIASGHVGIQHQWGNIVLGVEAGFAQPNILQNDQAGWFGQPCSNNVTVTCQMRVNHYYTVGPRVGYAHHRWLAYATGGWAEARVESRFITTATGAGVDNTSRLQNGWFYGAGLEHAITNHVILGVEYQHLDFGSELHCSSLGAPCAIPSINNRDISTTSDVVKARLTFKIGRDYVAEPLK
jgi:outer membrane immunogenic protein